MASCSRVAIIGDQGHDPPVAGNARLTQTISMALVAQITQSFLAWVGRPGGWEAPWGEDRVEMPAHSLLVFCQTLHVIPIVLYGEKASQLPAHCG
jgi:hypothetical protein